MTGVTQTATDNHIPRIVAVDALRGLAIVGMVIYHFAWDLSNFGFISVDVARDPWWTAFARIVAGTFVALVGVSLVLATRQRLRLQPYLRRLAIITSAAMLVTLGTWWFIPDSFVFFGILHLIAFASVAAFPFLFLSTPIILVAATAIFALPLFFAHEIFNYPLLWWVGLTPGVPANTIDYVPVFPWLAITLFGIVAGRMLVGPARDSWVSDWGPSGIFGRLAIFAGRWSLLIYLTHQLFLFGVLLLVERLIPPTAAVQAESFSAACVTSCRAAGREAAVCELFCGCVVAGIKDAGFLSAALSDRLTAEENNHWLSLVDQCQPVE